jgi:hypothetical protein
MADGAILSLHQDFGGMQEWNEVMSSNHTNDRLEDTTICIEKSAVCCCHQCWSLSNA